jgi:hypothetical protein
MAHPRRQSRRAAAIVRHRHEDPRIQDVKTRRAERSLDEPELQSERAIQVA